MSFRKVWIVSVKEAKEIWRDKIYLVMAFIFPLMLMNVLGFGLSFDVEQLPFAVVDEDNSSLSRELSHKFIDSRYFRYTGHLPTVKAGEMQLKRSKIRFLLVIPPGFERQLKQGRTAQIQTQIDGLFTYRAKVVKGYVSATIAHFNQQLLQQWMSKTRGISQQRLKAMLQPITLHTRYLYNNELRSIWSTGSGMIMLIMLMSPALLTALGVVREKESGSIYNIYASTVSRAEFITGKLLPYVLISLINITILTFAALTLFGVPFKGDPILFAFSSLIYVTCAAGIGLLISVFVNSQAAAALIAILGTLIPGMMYSGLMVPVSSMGAEAQIQAHLFPAYYELQIVWGSFLKGQGWPELWSNLLILTLYAVALWLLAVWKFKKRVVA